YTSKNYRKHYDKIRKYKKDWRIAELGVKEMFIYITSLYQSSVVSRVPSQSVFLGNLSPH
ncbi:hypothetical protein J6590_107455, partial [Homalodisca vitripennis]